MDRPPQIKAAYLEKLAIIYLRQSTEKQVEENTGSKEAQYRLTERARAWGWPESRIKVIDDDLGKSGARPGRRKGFHEMLQLMRIGDVAIVFVTEISRLSRNPLDAEEFLWVAISRGVLVSVDGALYAPGDKKLSELLNLRFQNLFAWWDHENLRQRFDNGKRVKSSIGHAVHHPPAGFIMPLKGKWIPDPDPAVGEAIARVFTLYLELGSANKVAQYMRAHGLLLPRRMCLDEDVS